MLLFLSEPQARVFILRIDSAFVKREYSKTIANEQLHKFAPQVLSHRGVYAESLALQFASQSMAGSHPRHAP